MTCHNGCLCRKTEPVKKNVLVKKTSYPSSFSLTSRQYRAIRNGIFDEIVVVDTDSGEVLTCFDHEQAFDLTEKAIAKVVGHTAEVYFVVRF